jgi:hypothetical protein
VCLFVLHVFVFPEASLEKSTIIHAYIVLNEYNLLKTNNVK